VDISRAIHIWIARKLPGTVIPSDAQQFPEQPEFVLEKIALQAQFVPSIRPLTPQFFVVSIGGMDVSERQG